MASLNHVFLAGNLTRDPEVRYMPSGDPVGELQLAVSRKFKSRDGQDREETCFIGIVVWGRQADTCKEYLRKGSPVLVEGRLQYEEWEKDGQKRNRIRVRANRVQFLGRPPSGGGKTADLDRDSKGDSGGETPEHGQPDDSGASGDDDNLPF
jgi:single-strand DNA-binding protein